MKWYLPFALFVHSAYIRILKWEGQLYGCMSERQQKHWHFIEVLHVTFQLHLVELTPLCTDKTAQT